MVIISSAINSMLARNMTVATSHGDIETSEKHYSSTFLANICVAVFMLIPIGVISFNSPQWFNIPKGHEEDIRILFLSVTLTVPLDMVITPLSVCWTVKDKLQYNYLSRTIQCIAKTALIYLFLYRNNRSIKEIGYAILLSDLLYSVLVIIIKRKIYKNCKVQLKK